MNGEGGTLSGTGGETPGLQFAESVRRHGWYILPYEVTWRDLDGAGHVNNAVYFTFFEWSRTRYWFDLHRLGTAAKSPGQLSFIVARAECDFKVQLGLTERIEIRVRVGEIRGTSFDFHNEIRRQDGTLAATGKVVVVLFDWDRNSKIPVSSELRERIGAFQNGEGAGRW